MSRKTRRAFWCALLAACVAGYGAAASPARADSATTVTHGVFQSGIVDDQGNFFPATCREVQIVNSQLRKETFHCVFTAGIPARTGPSRSGDLWFSDFDGTQATRTHFVVTPSGGMQGWAVY
jgi:hypothetical protein